MESVLVDAGFLLALLSKRDTHHAWAVSAVKRHPPPWKTCDAVLSEAFHVLGRPGLPVLTALLRRRAVTVAFEFQAHLVPVLKFMEKYKDVPASFADASLVRMSELHAESLILTTDEDFSLYRRHGRQAIPCERPVRPGR
jgi:predicted nucleic acid-binding protein